jgi:predicted nucleic acid-binding protein
VIFLDANIFLRHLVAPTIPATELMQEIANALFAAVGRGEEEITTSEVVLHEVCYVLGSKSHYGLPPETIVSYLAPILRLGSFKLPRGDKQIYLRAFEIFGANPKLEFSDSVIAARAEHLGVPLATFDEALGRLPVVDRWVPPKFT